MFMIAITAPWVFAVLILAAATLLTRMAFKYGRPHTDVIPALYAIALTQLALAATALYLTWVYPIGRSACQLGFFGFLADGLILAVEAVLLLILLIVSPQRTIKVLRDFRGFFITLPAAQLLALVISLRSALLCTV